jgi:hypothetical protein
MRSGCPTNPMSARAEASVHELLQLRRDVAEAGRRPERDSVCHSTWPVAL